MSEVYCLQCTQKIPLSLTDCWKFFSSPSNLQILTPEYLRFEIKCPVEIGKMYAGQIISYTICPLWNIPIQWVTEITHVHEHHYFIDEQRLGPYQFWHHEHRFISIPNGVLMTDIVFYKLPFGFVGKMLHALKVKKDIEAIFNYRKEKIETLFGVYTERGA